MLLRKDAQQVAPPQGNAKKYLSLGLAVLTCPCHAPILVAVLAGTALGGWTSAHLSVVIPAMAGIFILSLLYGLRANERPTAVLQTEAPRELEHETEEAWRGSQV